MKKDMKNTAAPANENELLRYWTMVLRRWHILALIVLPAVVGAVGYSLRTAPVYRATAQVLIEKEKENSGSKGEGVDVDTSEEDYYQTQYKLIKQRGLAQEVYNRLKLGETSEFRNGEGADDAGLLLEHIIVDPQRGSRLVSVSAESSSPELAAKIANALADAFVRQNLENRLHASREIMKRLPRNASITDLTDRQIMEAMPAVVSNPLIQSLKGELVKYQSEYADLSRRYKGRHPTVRAVQARIEYLQQQIDKEMKNAVSSVRSELSGDYKANNVRVVDYAARPSLPVRPNTRNNVAVAFALSAALAFGIIYFLEIMNLTIKEGADIERYLDLPFLGIVPVTKKSREEQLVMDEAHREPLEAIKTIRTNLTFSAPEDRLKTMLFTSCAPGAGKTFIALNISAAFAQGGKRVLLVDADLRRASLSKYLEKEERPGLSNHLVEHEPFERLVRATRVDNLDFLPAGSQTPNPAELLASNDMKAFVEKARARYDRVIFDSAPVLPISDTLNIANLMDGVVYVVFCGKFSYKTVALGKKKLEGVKARFAGAVLNFVNIKAKGYDYGYHRSYGKYY